MGFVDVHQVNCPIWGWNNSTDTIPNSPAGHQLPTQAKQNICIIAINGEDIIAAQGALDELNLHQTPHGKSKINNSLCRRNTYQRTDLE